MSRSQYDHYAWYVAIRVVKLSTDTRKNRGIFYVNFYAKTVDINVFTAYYRGSF